MADITIKTTEAKTIASIRDHLAGIAEIAPMFPRLFESVDPADMIDTPGQVYHEFSEDGSFIDFEAFIVVSDDFVAGGEAQVRRLEGAQVASYVHHGSFQQLPAAYDVMYAWIAENGYDVSGPSYEWNIVCDAPVTQDNESYVTEIQIEVTKR
jgi:effector-binding domain-containing protein